MHLVVFLIGCVLLLLFICLCSYCCLFIYLLFYFQNPLQEVHSEKQGNNLGTGVTS